LPVRFGPSICWCITNIGGREWGGRKGGENDCFKSLLSHVELMYEAVLGREEEEGGKLGRKGGSLELHT